MAFASTVSGWVRAAVVFCLLVTGAFVSSTKAQDHSVNSGPPYWYLYQNISDLGLPKALTLEGAIQTAKDGLTSKYGANATAWRIDPRVGDVSIPCHLHAIYIEPPSEWAARVEYTQDDGGYECTYQQGYILLHGTPQQYDIGKNRGACDHCGGNGGVSQAQGGVVQKDPINVATGNKYEEVVDYVSPSNWLTLRRFYNSMPADLGGSMGTLWRHSFDRSLQRVSPTVFNLYRPDGRYERFTRQVDGRWAADADITDRITEQVGGDGQVAGYAVFIAGTRDTETYSSAGLLISIAESSGAITTLTYSDPSTPVEIAPKVGLLLAVQDANGRKLTFTYDAKARVHTVQEPDGATVTYDYDANNYLTTVAYSGGGTIAYRYDEVGHVQPITGRTGLLTGVFDEKSVRYQTANYDYSAKVSYSSLAGGVDAATITSYCCGSTTVKSALGKVSQTRYRDVLGAMKGTGADQPCGNECNQPWGSITYDVSGSPVDTTDFNGVKTHTDYVNGLIIKQIDAVGTPQQRTITRQWDTVTRNPLMWTITDKDGVFVHAKGWSYNQRQQLLAECWFGTSTAASYHCGDQVAAPDGVRQVRYTYCDAVDAIRCPRIGLLLAVDGARVDANDEVHYSYYLTTDESGCGSPAGICHRAGDLYQTTDALGHITTAVAYDKSGRIVRRRDANGVLTDIAYSARGWPTSRVLRARADGQPSAGDAITRVEYEPTGNVHSVTDADGVTTTYAYDDAHRLIDVADSAGNHLHYTLDASGNPIKEETIDGSGVVRRSLARTFNTMGQLIKVSDGRGNVVFDASADGSYDVNGKLVSAKDATGVFHKDIYDALGRAVTRVANAKGSDTPTQSTTTTLAFDAMDQIRSVTDPDGLVTSYAFDGLRNLTGQISPDTGTQSATFDAAGNAMTQTDAKGTVVSLVYDALGRKTAASYADSSLNVAYHYDEADSVTGCQGSFPVGALTRIVETAVTTTYCYDRKGLVTEQRQTLGAFTDTTAYVYTQAGRLAAIASPSGLVTEYGRNALGQIVSVTVTPATGVATKVVTTATYLPFGPLASYTLGNGQVVNRTYDANYQVTDVTSPALNLHFARDPAGNITALGDVAGASPATETYVYDPLYRLTSVNDSSGKAIELYTYNRTGDRLSKAAPGLATGAYSYKSGTHWLTAIGTASRMYDANGSTTANVVAGTSWGYGYNGRGQLTVLQQSGDTVATYVYNALGQRVSKVVGSNATRFAYGQGRLLNEIGTTARDYIWLDDAPVGVVDAESIGFIHVDALNTPRVVTNQVGANLWGWSFRSNAFGESKPIAASYVFNLRFPGQYFDLESGFSYNFHRIYDAATGRYLQSDPLGLAAQISTFSYVGSSPLSWSDPYGLKPGDAFNSSKDAAVDALKYINPQSIRDAHEYAGMIYQVGDKFFATDPVRGGYSDSDSLNSSGVDQVRRSSGMPVGDYHTHGDYGYLGPKNTYIRTPKAESGYRDDCFSNQDKILSESRFAAARRAGQDGWTSYLGTPSGALRQYDPMTGVDSAIK